jgi:hypothetical protein
MSKIDELRVKYYNLKPNIFNRLVNGDETPTKKYAEFLLKTWSNRANNGCVRTINDLINLVKEFNNLLPYVSEKDIYHKSYLNINVLKDVVSVAEEEKDVKSFNRADHVEVLYEDDDTLFVIPKTHKGSLKYGSNTRWCTASKNDPDTFNRYIKHDLLAYLIDKTDKTTPQYRKLAFCSSWSEYGITNSILIYNTLDNTCQDKAIINGGWSDEVLLKMITIYRVKFINYKKIKDSIDAVNAFGNTLKRLNFDLLKDSLEKLEQSVEPSYISNLKENIDSFLEKLNTKQYGITTTKN